MDWDDAEHVQSVKRAIQLAPPAPAWSQQTRVAPYGVSLQPAAPPELQSRACVQIQLLDSSAKFIVVLPTRHCAMHTHMYVAAFRQNASIWPIPDDIAESTSEPAGCWPAAC